MENTYGSCLGIRSSESLRGFSFTNLRDTVSSKAIDINELRLQTVFFFFLNKETERQTLPFGKWFLDSKRKINEEEKEK